MYQWVGGLRVVSTNTFLWSCEVIVRVGLDQLTRPGVGCGDKGGGGRRGEVATLGASISTRQHRYRHRPSEECNDATLETLLAM